MRNLRRRHHRICRVWEWIWRRASGRPGPGVRRIPPLATNSLPKNTAAVKIAPAGETGGMISEIAARANPAQAATETAASAAVAANAVVALAATIPGAPLLRRRSNPCSKAGRCVFSPTDAESRGWPNKSNPQPKRFLCSIWRGWFWKNRSATWWSSNAPATTSSQSGRSKPMARSGPAKAKPAREPSSPTSTSFTDGSASRLIRRRAHSPSSPFAG